MDHAKSPAFASQRSAVIVGVTAPGAQDPDRGADLRDERRSLLGAVRLGDASRVRGESASTVRKGSLTIPRS